MRPRMRSLLLKANKKVTGQSSREHNREACREQTTEAWFPIRVMDEPAEEDEIPLKCKRSTPSAKGKQLRTAPSGTPTGEGELIELPNVWSKLDKFGPQSTLFLGDRELMVISYLGVAGRSQVMTEGIIGAIKSLEIVVVLNNSSTKGLICADAMHRRETRQWLRRRSLITSLLM